MLDPAISEFFQGRKEAWLKKNIKTSMNDAEIEQLHTECNALFSLDNWLPNAAKRAGQIAISTHPCTFSHPSARKNKNGYVTSTIAQKNQENDGYLRSGNVDVSSDALGNAAALDVHKFLTLELAEGGNLLNHLQQDSDLVQKLFSIQSQSYQELKEGFMAMVDASSELVTSSKIKQVYFPIDNSQYHQLSLLTASGLVFELRKRIDELRFPKSDYAIEIRANRKSKEYHIGTDKQITDITTIAYGGTKPQNISVLNNQNAGKAHLLLSVPPALARRNIQFPNNDFFTQTINPYQFRNHFYDLHSLFIKHKNNWQIREERDDYYRKILERISEIMWQIRHVSVEQYQPKTSQLSGLQKKWLCHNYADLRETEDSWLKEISKTVADFIFHGYENVLKKKAFKFSDEEFEHIYTLVINHQEALR